MFAPDMGPFFVRTAAVSVENTHNFAGGAVLPLGDLQALRAWADAVGVRRPPRRRPASGTRTSPPARRWRRTARIADVLAVCLSKGLGAPIGSLMVGSADAVAEARVLAQAAGRRHAPGRRARGRRARTRSTTTSSGWPRTTRTPGCWPRRCGVDPAGVDTNIVVVDRPDAAAFVAAAREAGGADRRRSGRGRCGWSPTSTSTRADAERAAAVLATPRLDRPQPRLATPAG